MNVFLSFQGTTTTSEDEEEEDTKEGELVSPQTFTRPSHLD
jgi:hypothetical protein